MPCWEKNQYYCIEWVRSHVGAPDDDDACMMMEMGVVGSSWRTLTDLNVRVVSLSGPVGCPLNDNKDQMGVPCPARRTQSGRLPGTDHNHAVTDFISERMGIRDVRNHKDSSFLQFGGQFQFV